MKKPKQIISFLFINALLTGSSIYLLKNFRLNDIYFTICIYVPVLIQLILGKNLLFDLNNTFTKVVVGIMIIIGFVLNSLFLKSEDIDGEDVRELYLNNEASDLIYILVIYYLILIFTEWILSNNNSKIKNDFENINNSSKIDNIKLLLNLRKEGEILAEHFEEEIEKLIK